MFEHARTEPSAPTYNQQPDSAIIVRMPAANWQPSVPPPIRFFRHPSDMPVKVIRRKQGSLPRHWLHSVSRSGLACFALRSYRFGCSVELQIPVLGEQARYPGVVIWCHKVQQGYLTGVAFLDEETQFRARMTEQICQIEHYRRQRERELGERLPIESVAQEWVTQHAAEFAMPI